MSRNYKLTVMLSDEEHYMLDALADARGLNASDWICQSVRSTYEASPPGTQKRVKK